MLRALLPFVLIGSLGCVVSTSSLDPVTPYQGRLVVDWSIDLSKDPTKCTQSASDAIEVTVSGPSGGTFTRVCEDFATSIELDAGNYTATAVLIDSAGRARTTHVDLQPFTIRSNDSLNIPVDFPADSFY